MLDSGTLIGGPRLRVLSSDLQSTLYTYYLPFPNKDGGVVMSTVWAKAIKTQLLSGAIRFIPGGVRHNLTLTWDLYDPTYTGKTVGTANNNTPELTDLFDIIATYNSGRLSISPCTNKEIWFRCCCTSDLTRQTIYPAGFGALSLTFEGLDLFSNASSQSPVA